MWQLFHFATMTTRQRIKASATSDNVTNFSLLFTNIFINISKMCRRLHLFSDSLLRARRLFYTLSVQDLSKTKQPPGQPGIGVRINCLPNDSHTNVPSLNIPMADFCGRLFQSWQYSFPAMRNHNWNSYKPIIKQSWPITRNLFKKQLRADHETIPGQQRKFSQ